MSCSRQRDRIRAGRRQVVIAHEVDVTADGMALVAAVPRLNKPIRVVKGEIGRRLRVQAEVGIEAGAIIISRYPNVTKLVPLAVLPTEQARFVVALIGE